LANSAHVTPAPDPQRCRAAPLPAPGARYWWCSVCLCWREPVTVASARGAERGAVLRGPRRRACLHRITNAGHGLPPPFPRGRPSQPLTARPPCIARDNHQYQQWRAGEGAGQRHWRVGAWSRGRAAQYCCVHLQACMQARTRAQC